MSEERITGRKRRPTGYGTRNPDIWFPAKRRGWGWGPPVRWQGWAVLGAYTLLLLAGSFILRGDAESVSLYVAYVLALSAALVWVCWKKGEKPKRFGRQ